MTCRSLPSRWSCLLVAAVLSVAAACGGGDGGSAPSTTTAASGSTERPGGGGSPDGTEVEPEELDEDQDLYAVPDPIPDVEHGTLLRYQEITPSPVDGGRAWRVMYSSESVAGDPIVVTGVTVVPEASAPDGGRPVLAVAHGTRGIADDCAPSKEGGAVELALMGPMLERGWIVAVTDYEGLGTPGRHPYLVGASEGRSVVDSVLAAADLPDAEASDRVAIAGYSQGGHGALFAGEVAPEWAPGLDVVGTFAGAPATEMGVILNAAPRLAQAGFAYMIVAGFGAAHPDLDLGTFLTEEGERRLSVVDEACAPEVISSVAGIPAEELVRDGAAGSEPWRSLAEENDPGRVVTDSPVLVVHSDDDGVVPPALSAIMFERMCTEGQVAERRVLEAAGGHGGAAPEAYRIGLDWLQDLHDGGEPVDGCPG